MKQQKIIVSGATGQDGSFMCEFLLKNTNHLVLAGVRRTSQPILKNLDKCLDNPRFKLVPLELTDNCSITSLIKNENPDYFINFGASSFVADSWNQPAFTIEANTISVINCLEAIRNHAPNCRFYSSGSSEEWGNIEYSPQDIKHPKKPRSIYGVSKCAAGLACKVYRESYDLFAIHGILTNHESERRQEHFVTRKITTNVARIRHAILNKQPIEPLELGNIDAKRDWSHAQDFIEGIWLMMNQEKHRKNLDNSLFKSLELQGDNYSRKIAPVIKEYILSSQETHSVREFVEKSFAVAGIAGYWEGSGVDEKFLITDCVLDASSFHLWSAEQERIVGVSINPKFYRPAEVDILLGDSSEARSELGWSPKISFDNLVERMVVSDIDGYNTAIEKAPKAQKAQKTY